MSCTSGIDFCCPYDDVQRCRTGIVTQTNFVHTVHLYTKHALLLIATLTTMKQGCIVFQRKKALM